MAASPAHSDSLDFSDSQPSSKQGSPVAGGHAGNDSMGAGFGSNTGSTSGNGKASSRRPPSTAERRANHNAIERARRETLNGRFLDLAAALPSMVSSWSLL
jgi:hypothetical protein